MAGFSKSGLLLETSESYIAFSFDPNFMESS